MCEIFRGCYLYNLNPLEVIRLVSSLQLAVLYPKSHELINECTSYETAVNVLKSAYVKTTNEVFARHLLSIRKQQQGETLDEFLQNLKVLSKDCNFKSVTAEQHREEYIRDSFISGLQSNAIRQRLLENNTLDLGTMFNQARALEAAQKSVDSYNNIYESSINAITKMLYVKNKNAGIAEILCFNCGHKGHFSKVCRSTKQVSNQKTAAATFPLIA